MKSSQLLGTKKKKKVAKWLWGKLTMDEQFGACFGSGSEGSPATSHRMQIVHANVLSSAAAQQPADSLPLFI